jgi:hypothetical protein
MIHSRSRIRAALLLMFVGVTISAFPAAKPHTVTFRKVDHGSMVAQYSRDR